MISIRNVKQVTKILFERHDQNGTWFVMAVMIPMGSVNEMAIAQASKTPHHGS